MADDFDPNDPYGAVSDQLEAALRDRDWNELRRLIDENGRIALEQAVARGTSRKLAAARIARFNDLLVERFKAGPIDETVGPFDEYRGQ